jgi:molybdopterin-guanine dinucleotide biosynthesis protein A
MFVVACDTPLIERTVYDRLIKEMDEETDAAIAVTEDGNCHPLCGIYKKSVEKILEEQILSGNNRMMHVLKKIRTKYVDVKSKEYGLYNINTPEEYQKLCVLAEEK